MLDEGGPAGLGKSRLGDMVLFGKGFSAWFGKAKANAPTNPNDLVLLGRLFRMVGKSHLGDMALRGRVFLLGWEKLGAEPGKV